MALLELSIWKNSLEELNNFTDSNVDWILREMN